MGAKQDRQCGAVFKVGANSPASCALRFNHRGSHRSWAEVADDRAELLEALSDILCVVRDRAPEKRAAIAALAKAEGKSNG